MAPKNKVEPTKPDEKNVNAPPKTVGVTETALAPRTQAGPLASSAPAWLQAKMGDQAPRGLENVDRDDIILPRIVLCQALTPAVVEGKARVGDMIDNLTGDVLCAKGEELAIIPVTLSKSRMYFKDIKEGGGTLCRAADGKTAAPGGIGKDQGGNPTRTCADCVHKEFKDSGEDSAPDCTNFLNTLVLLPGRDYQPYVWSLKSTGIKVGKKFLTTAKQTGADFFAQKYTIKAIDAQSKNFKFQNFEFKVAGWVDQAEYQRAEQFHATLEGKSWSPDTSDLDEEVAAEKATPAGEQTVDARQGEEEAPF